MDFLKVLSKSWIVLDARQDKGKNNPRKIQQDWGIINCGQGIEVFTKALVRLLKHSNFHKKS